MIAKHLAGGRTKGFMHISSQKAESGISDETNQGNYLIVGSWNICNSYLVEFDYCHGPVTAVCFSISLVQ